MKSVKLLLWVMFNCLLFVTLHYKNALAYDHYMINGTCRALNAKFRGTIEDYPSTRVYEWEDGTIKSWQGGYPDNYLGTSRYVWLDIFDWDVERQQWDHIFNIGNVYIIEPNVDGLLVFYGEEGTRSDFHGTNIVCNPPTCDDLMSQQAQYCICSSPNQEDCVSIERSLGNPGCN